ncbi:unnamed protein product, partial [Brenthis ino]
MSLYDKSQDEMLIDLVSKRPIIYSSSHPQHRNYIEKHRAWEEISAILNTPIPGLKQRWKHFRDHYHKKKKQTQKKTQWKYMHLLSFLSQHPKKDALPENKTEKKEMTQKLSTAAHNESSDFSNVSEYENEGSESASSTGSFSYKQAELLQPELATTAKHLDPPYEEARNQTDHKHAQTIKEKQEIQSCRQKLQRIVRTSLLKSYIRRRARILSRSNHKSSESPTREMSIDTSLGLHANSNNHEIRKSTTTEPTLVPGVLGANSEASGSRSEVVKTAEFIESTRKISSGHGDDFDELQIDQLRNPTIRKESSPLSPIGPVHRFYEAVAEVVSMFPPHLVSKAKLAIHKSIYQIERECLGLMDDDDDDDLNSFLQATETRYGAESERLVRELAVPQYVALTKKRIREENEFLRRVSRHTKLK